MILQELLRLQDRHGYLPRRQLAALANRLGIPLFRVHEVATFYPHFHVFASDEEEQREAGSVPEFEIAVCRDMACQLRGAAAYAQALAEAVRPCDGRATVREVSCLGRCDRAPAVRVVRHVAAPSSATSAQSSAQSSSQHDAEHGVRALLGRPLDEVVGVVRALVAASSHGTNVESLPNDRDADLDLPQPADQWKIDVYRGVPREQRYAAIRRFVASRTSDPSFDAERDRVIQALQTANLLGMGGAGGRAYKKWSEVREAIGERKYVVCNADESEPGTFKDRELLLRTPYLVLEGVLLGGLVTGAKRGYIYIRHEYEEAIAAMRDEIAWAVEQGLCGDDLLGSGLSMQVEVFVSPGGYICGEQTALVQAIQDERAEPRNRPPELQTNGLWNMPTLLNNVETLAWTPAIATHDGGTGQWYADQGKPGYKGVRFFSISGDVERPGVYEVPIGITLGELLDAYCGGMRGGRPLKAVALSGPSGGFLPPSLPIDSFSSSVRDKVQQLAGADATSFDLRKLPLDLGVTRQLRLMLGAAIVVYAEGTDIVQQTLSCLKFYKAESCGKCVPCRIGSTKMVEMCEDLHAGRLTRSDVDRLADREQGEVFALAQAMAETAICGLGTSVPNPFKSLLAYFPDDVQRYLRPS